MAPIQKTRRRAQKELNELNEWFSDVLDDASHFMRYENVDYPELTWEQANAGWDDQYIDDEFYISHQVENWRRIEQLTEPLTQMDNLPADINPRWQKFRAAFPSLVGATTLLLFLPFILDFFFLFLSGLTSWFLSSEKDYINKKEWESENGDDNSESNDHAAANLDSPNHSALQIDSNSIPTTPIAVAEQGRNQPTTPSASTSFALERNQLPHFEKTYYNEINQQQVTFQQPIDFIHQKAFDSTQQQIDMMKAQHLPDTDQHQ